MLCRVIERPSCRTTSGLSVLFLLAFSLVCHQEESQVKLKSLKSPWLGCHLKLLPVVGSAYLSVQGAQALFGSWLLGTGLPLTASQCLSTWPIWAAGQGDAAGCW